MTVRLDAVERQVAAGSSTRFQVSLRNRSARADSFTVKSTVRGGSGWSSSVSSASVTVPSGATGAVTVTVGAPSAVSPGTVCPIDIEVRSALDSTRAVTVHANVVIRTAPPVIVGGVLVETVMGATVQVPLSAQGSRISTG